LVDLAVAGEGGHGGGNETSEIKGFHVSPPIDVVRRTLPRGFIYLKTQIRHFRYNKSDIGGGDRWTTPRGSSSSTPPRSGA
jgi:hypothetical protein